MTLTVGSCCSGVGGLDLGLERAGMRVLWQAETNPHASAVLARHWPDTPNLGDMTRIEWSGVPRVDVIAGGPPCQPFSQAGQRLGVVDERWLWPAMRDAVAALGPRWVLVENVAALLTDSDAFGRILSDLSALGFDAEWTCLSACALGAPHTRDRLFVVAHADARDGQARLGIGSSRQRAVPPRNDQAGPWGDPINGALEAAAHDDRVANGIAAALVGAGGNAVVPQVAEYIGQQIVAADKVAADV